MSKLLLKKRIFEIAVEFVIINKKLLNSKNSVFFTSKRNGSNLESIRNSMFVLWVRLSIEFWSLNVTNCYLERRFCLSQDYNRAIRRLLKSSLQQRFTLVQEVSYSNQEEPDLYECHFHTYRVLSFGEILLLILCQKRFYDHSVETIFPAKNKSSINLNFLRKKRKALLFKCLQNMFFSEVSKKYLAMLSFFLAQSD